MLKVILTKGLPGSGKSTWAKELISKHPNSYKRINKDDLRDMLDNNHHSGKSEDFILKVRDSIILLALTQGKHVIVDDTNLNPTHETHIAQLIKGKATLEIKDFTNIPLQTCIQNDLRRPKSVGEKVIKQMYNKYLNKPNPIIQNPYLPKAIIVDIDGTLALMNNRTPFEWNKVSQDLPNYPIINIVQTYPNTIIIVSGRDQVCQLDTINWLQKHEIPFNHLHMRPANNFEPDTTIKNNIFHSHIKDKFFIEYVLDDRTQVVDLWRSLGLTCLQVAYGDF